MSGVYLIVDTSSEFKSDILKPTKGGWPHVTVAWTGKHLSERLLAMTGSQVFNQVDKKEEFQLTSSYVNSFQKSDGTWRHDVLMGVDEHLSEFIDSCRNVFFIPSCSMPKEMVAKFNMQKPHVTHGIYNTKEKAELASKQLNEMLPINISITGFTID